MLEFSEAPGVGRVSRERPPGAKLGGVVDETHRRPAEVRVESQAGEPPLVEFLEQGHHVIAQIEKRRLEALASGGEPNVDYAGLLADEAATAAFIGRHQEGGRAEAAAGSSTATFG